MEDAAVESRDPFDKEIAYFNKKLGNKKSKSERLDGLDSILDGLSVAGRGSRKGATAAPSSSDDDDYLDSLQFDPDLGESDYSTDSDLAVDGEEEEEGGEGGGGSDHALDSTSDNDTVGAEDEEDETEKDEESEDVSKPPASSSVPTYVPPHLRRRLANDVESPLARELRGMLNKMARSNFESVLPGFERLLKAQSRGDFFEALIHQMVLNCENLGDAGQSFTVTYAALITVFHSREGMEVGGKLLTALSAAFQRHYDGEEGSQKALVNLLLLVLHLYNFALLHHQLIFDLIRMFLGRFRELDIELLLLTIRTIGIQLRSEASVALSEILAAIECKVRAQTQGCSSARALFMIDTIMDLKNNKRRFVSVNDDVQHFKVALQRLKVKAADAGVIRVSWEDLLQHRGRWWVVGSAASDMTHALLLGKEGGAADAAVAEGFGAVLSDPKSARILELARRQKMNTDVRRAIFCVLLSSEDYVDCFAKLLDLKLKGKQDRDIVYVLLHCCLMEKQYNKYYELLAIKLCTFEHNYKFTFQFHIWDHLKELGDLARNPRKLDKLGRFLAGLISSFTFSMAVLKIVEWHVMSNELRTLLNYFFSYLLTIPPDEATQIEPHITELFKRVVVQKNLENLCQGLMLFLKQYRKLIKSRANFASLGLPPSISKDVLKKNARLAYRVLQESSAALFV